MTELMLSDLPHIQYHYKIKLTDEQIKIRKDLNEDMDKKIQKSGLSSALGVSFMNKSAISAEEYMDKAKNRLR